MTAKIIEIIQETKDVKSFRLQATMKYLPGQWMYVRLDEELKHHFTISSSPTEPHVQFTTMFREESDYKKALWQKKVGDEVDINGPFGSFVLDEKDSSPRLLIAGGIGITPFRSMIKYAVDKGLKIPMTLVYSVKTKEQAVFADLPDTRLIETEKEGRLDEEKIKKYCPDWKERTWWVCGPPAMVEAFMTLGQKMGLASGQIKSEEFSGY